MTVNVDHSNNETDSDETDFDNDVTDTDFDSDDTDIDAPMDFFKFGAKHLKGYRPW
jgi:hypothetical protein